MKQWGLAMVSVGGVLVMVSQLPPIRPSLIAAGVSFMVIGFLIYKKA